MNTKPTNETSISRDVFLKELKLRESIRKIITISENRQLKKENITRIKNIKNVGKELNAGAVIFITKPESKLVESVSYMILHTDLHGFLDMYEKACNNLRLKDELRAITHKDYQQLLKIAKKKQLKYYGCAQEFMVYSLSIQGSHQKK